MASEKHRYQWKEDEVLSLLAMWKTESEKRAMIPDPEKQRRFPIYANISLNMRQLGYEKTAKQCRIKMSTMHNIWQKKKSDHLQGRDRNVWKYFVVFDSIMECVRCLNQASLVNDSAILVDAYNTDDGSDLPCNIKKENTVQIQQNANSNNNNKGSNEQSKDNHHALEPPLKRLRSTTEIPKQKTKTVVPNGPGEKTTVNPNSIYQNKLNANSIIPTDITPSTTMEEKRNTKSCHLSQDIKSDANPRQQINADSTSQMPTYLTQFLTTFSEMQSRFLWNYLDFQARERDKEREAELKKTMKEQDHNLQLMQLILEMKSQH